MLEKDKMVTCGALEHINQVEKNSNTITVVTIMIIMMIIIIIIIIIITKS